MRIDIKAVQDAIVERATQDILADDDIWEQVKAGIDERLNKLFASTLDRKIEEAVSEAINAGLDAAYFETDAFGKPTSNIKTTIRAKMADMAMSYWQTRVNKRTGTPTTDNYNSISRAEFLMTEIGGKEFSDNMRQAAVNVTAELKDAFRGQMGKQIDTLLNELFHVKSIQDQGKAQKPY